jgi:hypothetical protein
MRLSFKVGMAVVALCALFGNAKAGGSLDYDDGSYAGSTGYRGKTLSQICSQDPDDPRCDDDRGGSGSYRYRAKKSYSSESYGEGGGACRATIRAAGKRNLFPGFARNSAIFSWQREVRAVYGPTYASWGNSQRPDISCGPGGGALVACVATAKPCRY